MTILVTGSTGVIGTQVLEQLKGSGAAVHALTRTPDRAHFPAEVTPVKSDLTDIDSLRRAMKDISTVFLLVSNAADELTQALQALNVARDAGVKGIVYLSVFKGEAYADVPHFASKHAVERMIEQSALPATVLRPAYFIQNDIQQKESLLNHGVYAIPIGSKGISMVDIRDIGEATARELLRRESASGPLPFEVYDLVGPDALNADSMVAIWADVLHRPIRYVGDDLDPFEARLKAFAPPWFAYDMRLMMHRYQQDGAVASSAQLERFASLLGRKPRTYRDFAANAGQAWANN
jgi:uncharacterized protein YbjT (DUF2867 family)